MRINIILTLLFITACSNQNSKKSVSKLENFDDSTSYAIGADLGTNLKRQNIDVNYDVFLAGS